MTQNVLDGNKTLIFAADVSTLENEKLFAEAYNRLTEERRSKIDRFEKAEDKRLSCSAEILLSHALEKFTGRKIKLEIERNKEGKPYLKNENVFFNLSHSGSVVLCAVSDYEVGCDVEKIKEIDLNLAKRFFCTQEYERIISCKMKELQTEMFFRYWTLKESFIKAIGKGLSLPFDAFEIVFDDKVSVRQNVNDKTYCFNEFAALQGYKCALCTAGNSEATELFVEDISEILK